MKRRWPKALSLIFSLLVAATLFGCGHGGTEVGNPPGPQVPNSGSPGMEDDGATPTPSPDANLQFDEAGDQEEIALNPEENER